MLTTKHDMIGFGKESIYLDSTDFVHLLTAHSNYVSLTDVDGPVGPIVFSVEDRKEGSPQRELKVLVQSKKVLHASFLPSFFYPLNNLLYFSVISFTKGCREGYNTS